MADSSPPLATYRVQLHADFDFAAAAAIAPYLSDLGVSHMYCSPYLQAAPGSTHGYDVVDPSRVNADLGGRAGLLVLHRALDAAGLQQVLDIVPNHMAVAGRRNPWWWDVLENGPASRYADFFDIDWDPPEHKLAATILVPVLGDHYGRVLEDGELVLTREGGSFLITYHDHEVPISPRSLDGLLAAAAASSGSDELAFLARAHARLPAATETTSAAVTERHRDKEILRSQLDRLCRRDPQAASAIDDEVARVNGDPDTLDDLLSRQNYRLAYWRTAGRELDYRRFFDVNTLVAVRVEEPEVFDATHALVAELVRDGVVHGLRIDHIDGLRDPAGYLERLSDRVRPSYVVVEKILEGHEDLPRGWPVAGTTGYDFLNEVNRLLVDPSSEEAMTEAYQRFSGDDTSWSDEVGQAKQVVLRTILAADVERLTARFSLVCEGRRRYRDFTRDELRDAIREVAAAFPVYRTYVQPGEALRPADRAIVDGAIADAGGRRPDLDHELLRFLGRILVLDVGGPVECDLALRFQQLSGPVMAKAVEDTAFYRHVRMASLNEVGGDPGRFGAQPADFHRAAAHIAEHWPAAMLTLSTHDTKRSADVRARMAVLSEIPDRWAAFVADMAQRCARHRTGDHPDPAAEYLMYQTLAGAWPLDERRIVRYMEKATREAKRHTSWTDPNPDYDEAVRVFAAAAVGDADVVATVERFLDDNRVVEAGVVNALAQTTLLLTAPGVPDLYQGTEAVDLSLVDPDNRRPVDHAGLAGRLRGVAVMDAASVSKASAADRKLWLVHRLLHARRRHPALQPGSSYQPIELGGRLAEKAVGFVRGGTVAVVVPCRGLASLAGWGDTTCALPDGAWRSLLTGRTHHGGPAVSVDDLAGDVPVAVLARG